MTSSSDTKKCLACSKPLKGRIDKKFCDDYCRNSYNNQQKAKGSHSSYVRNINNALLKNRKILETILLVTEETAKANKDKLLIKKSFEPIHKKYGVHPLQDGSER